MKTQTMLSGAIALRPFSADDVGAVNKLFKDAYGPEYPYAMSTVIPDGTYCYVAVAQGTDQVVGFARTRWLQAEHVTNAYPNVHELGGYVVATSHRRQGIGDALSGLCEEAAQADQGEIHVANSEPVCWGNGLASQRIFKGHGFQVCGMSPVKYPGISPEHHGRQPASMVMVARRSRNGQADASFTSHVRHLPHDYEELVCQLLGEETTTRRNGDALAQNPMPDVVFHKPVATARDIGAEIVDVPANWLETPRIIEWLRAEGWLFSAFLPEHGEVKSGGRSHRFDYLRLYLPPPRYRGAINWDLLGVHDPMATEVKRFLMTEHTARARR